MKKEIFTVFARAVFILVFLYTAFSKLLDFKDFKRAMHKQPFPNWMADILLYSLPTVEIIIAIMLMSTWWRKGMALSTALMALFTGYIIIILLNGFGRIPCSCGGIISSMNWRQHLVLNIFLLSIGVIGVTIIRREGVACLRGSHQLATK